ncbi:MAG: diphthine synthase [Candidatus Pacearchaeota archaeon]
MLYVIGTGLGMEDISFAAIKILKKCDYFFIDNYTTKIPFKIKKYEQFLTKIVRKKISIKELTREMLEEKSDELIRLAKNANIALLVYGDPLIATTHIALINEARKQGIKIKIVHNVSIINAITETGLSPYKFGKIASMPRWQEGYKPESFYDIIKQNLSINSHTLLLIDSELSFEQALKQLAEVDKEKILKHREIFVCSRLGTSQAKIKKIKLEGIKEDKIEKPFCFIIPSEIAFYERVGMKVEKEVEKAEAINNKHKG